MGYTNWICLTFAGSCNHSTAATLVLELKIEHFLAKHVSSLMLKHSVTAKLSYILSFVFYFVFLTNTGSLCPSG